MARRRNSTEATVKRVAMTSDIKVGEPLKPEEVIEYKTPDKEIKDQIEAFDCILKMAGVNKTVKEMFTEKGWTEWTNDKGEKMVMDNSWRIARDYVRRFLEDSYWNKWAYIKKWDKELFWKVFIRPYDSFMNTPYGKVLCPLMTVESVPAFFPVSKLLSREQVQTYELYNNKTEDFDKREMEKKIMSDLIAYSQIWVKWIADCKAIFDRIQSECEKIWVVKSIKFDNGIFYIDFDWRMIVDSSGDYKPRVAPPFRLMINFKDKYIECSWEHPHNLHPDPCLWGILSQVRDKCFKSWDIYWLVMWMVQFWNQWTSTDAGGTDREPWHCLRRHLDWMSVNVEKTIMELPVTLSDMVETLTDIQNENYFLMRDSRGWFKQKLDDEDFVNILLAKIGKAPLQNIFACAYLDWSDKDEAKYETMKAKYL